MRSSSTPQQHDLRDVSTAVDSHVARTGDRTGCPAGTKGSSESPEPKAPNQAGCFVLLVGLTHRSTDSWTRTAWSPKV